MSTTGSSDKGQVDSDTFPSKKQFNNPFSSILRSRKECCSTILVLQVDFDIVSSAKQKQVDNFFVPNFGCRKECCSTKRIL